VETIHPPQEMKWASSKACRAKNLQVSAMGLKADVGRSSGTTRPTSLAASAGDVLLLARAGYIDCGVLKARYLNELRPCPLNKHEWRDQTLELWTEMMAAWWQLFGARGLWP
jgi:hypothetical protein